ncbi:hypothetical protein SESBI_20406 [Sesbania bispinosa]|nr:hypothetical protein SESBI_20406 [Sesbania bispinosa]
MTPLRLIKGLTHALNQQTAVLSAQLGKSVHTPPARGKLGSECDGWKGLPNDLRRQVAPCLKCGNNHKGPVCRDKERCYYCTQPGHMAKGLSEEEEKGGYPSVELPGISSSLGSATHQDRSE